MSYNYIIITQMLAKEDYINGRISRKKYLFILNDLEKDIAKTDHRYSQENLYQMFNRYY